MNKIYNVDEVLIDHLRDFLDELENKITNGKIIDQSELNKYLNDIKDEVDEYNEKMNEWYDKDYHQDFESFNKILEIYNTNSFFFNELSIISINSNDFIKLDETLSNDHVKQSETTEQHKTFQQNELTQQNEVISDKKNIEINENEEITDKIIFTQQLANII